MCGKCLSSLQNLGLRVFATSAASGEVLCRGPIAYPSSARGSSSGEDCQPGYRYWCVGGVGRVFAYPAATAAAARADDDAGSAAGRGALCGAELAAAAAGACVTRLLASPQGPSQGASAPCRASRRAPPPRDAPPRASRGAGLRAAALRRTSARAGSHAAAAVGQPPAGPEEQPELS